MRLLVVTNDFPPTVGGIENYIYSLVRRWPAGEVVVLTRQVHGSERFDAAHRFEIVREPVNLLLPTPGLMQKARKLVADRNIDAVHFPSALPLGLMGRPLGAPYAVSVHGGEFVLASRLPFVRAALRKLCDGACLILPENTYATRMVQRFIKGNKPVQEVPCGVDVERYAPGAVAPVEIRDSGPVLVSVCRLIPRKGARTLIEILPEVRRRCPGTHLLIVGDGPDRSTLERIVATAGLNKAVTLAGAQPWDEIPRYLAAADVFALPTRRRFLGIETEGLPMVFCEAAAAALPLVGGDSGGVADAVRDGETGIIVDGSRPEQCAQAIIRLLSDRDEAARMGRAARRMAEQEFSWDALYERYRAALSLYCAAR